MKKLFFVAPLILTVFLLLGCAKKTDTSAPAPLDVKTLEAMVPAGEAKVIMKDFAFVPPTVTIKVGTTVNWFNEDSAKHRIIFKDLYDSGNLAEGDSFTINFDKAGTFDYSCSFHPSMTGKVIVQ